MSCDDPQTSRFVDAVAAGCIPVIINDGFALTAAPFSRSLNYAAFTRIIPEQMWLTDTASAAHFAYNWPEAITRQMFTSLLAAQPKLLWHAGTPQDNVARSLWQTADADCG